MSYILDALKRADTERERERGHVPGLHSQNLPGGMISRERKGKARPAPTRWALIAALSLLTLLLAYIAWRTFASGPDEGRGVVQAPVTTLPAPAPPDGGNRTASGPASQNLSAPPTLSASRAPELPILAPPPPAPPSPPSTVAPVPAPAATASPRATQGPPATPNSGSAAGPTPTPPAAAPAEAPVRRFADLPAEFRSQLPQVNISGSTYSSNPAQRTLIANGKMVQEGGEVAPGLKLESIGPRNAVLNYQGTRYSIGY